MMMVHLSLDTFSCHLNCAPDKENYNRLIENWMQGSLFQ